MKFENTKRSNEIYTNFTIISYKPTNNNTWQKTTQEQSLTHAYNIVQ